MTVASLDVTGLSCPLPVLRANKALRQMETGQVLRVLATDPASLNDMPLFCQQTGHILLSVSGDPPGVLEFHIQRG